MSTYTLPGQWDKTKHLNAKSLSSTAPTRLGSGLTDHPQTFRRLFLTTAGHDTMTYGRGRQVRRPNDVEQWMIPRNMYLSLLQQAKIEVLLPGHPTVQVGDVVSFDLPAAAMKDHTTADSDQVFSGRYLVTATASPPIPWDVQLPWPAWICSRPTPSASSSSRCATPHCLKIWPDTRWCGAPAASAPWRPGMWTPAKQATSIP